MNLARPTLIRRVGYALLIPALVLFSLRAALQIAGATDLPGWSLAIVGIMSGLAMLALVVVNWKTPDQWRTIAAVAVALLGHYVVSDFVNQNLGGAMVYLGTGFLVSLKLRWASFAGMIAGVGAILRDGADPTISNMMLIAGALALAAAAGIVSFGSEKVPETPSKSTK